MKHYASYFLISSLLFLCTSFDKHETYWTAEKIGKVKNQNDTVPTPKLILEMKSIDPMKVLVIADTVSSVSEIGSRISQLYGDLFAFITEFNLKPGKVMAFYLTDKPPFVYEAGVEVDRIPAVMGKGIRSKKLVKGNAIVAHYTGPYDRIDIAYTAIYDWLKENGKKSSGKLFEVYLNDPVSVKNPYELKTDVYQLIR